MNRIGSEVSTLLEVVVQLHGDLRKILEPLRVTPLQAGTLLFVSRHAKTNLTDAAATLRVRQPTLKEVVKSLVRKRWVTQRRSVTDSRVLHLQLSLQGHLLALHIEQRMRQVEATLIGPDLAALSMRPESRASTMRHC
jgi:DNA-binding MarR family transcriptional regulator